VKQNKCFKISFEPLLPDSKEYVKLQNIIYIFTFFFLTSGTWLKIVQGLDLKICRLSVLSLVYFALFRLYELSPVNRKRFGSSAIICKPVTNFP
jgi:hypothetical protein